MYVIIVFIRKYAHICIEGGQKYVLLRRANIKKVAVYESTNLTGKLCMMLTAVMVVP